MACLWWCWWCLGVWGSYRKSILRFLLPLSSVTPSGLCFKSHLKGSCAISFKGNARSYSLQPSCFLGFADVFRMLTLHPVLSRTCTWTMSSWFFLEEKSCSLQGVNTGRKDKKGKKNQTRLVLSFLLLKHQGCMIQKATSVSTC